MMEMLDHTADVGFEPGTSTQKDHFVEEISRAYGGAADVIEARAEAAR